MLCVSRRRSCAAALDVVDCVCALLCVVLTCCYCSFFNNDDVLYAQPTTIPIEDCWLTDKTQAKWQRLHSHIHTLSALGYPLFHSLGRCVKMRWDCNRTYASQNEVFFCCRDCCSGDADADDDDVSKTESTKFDETDSRDTERVSDAFFVLCSRHFLWFFDAVWLGSVCVSFNVCFSSQARREWLFFLFQ